MGSRTRVVTAIALGLLVVAFAVVWLWHSGGVYVCSASLSHYDATSSICLGGKLGVASYPVTAAEQLEGVLGVLGNLRGLALMLLLALGLPVAVWLLKESAMR